MKIEGLLEKYLKFKNDYCNELSEDEIARQFLKANPSVKTFFEKMVENDDLASKQEELIRKSNLESLYDAYINSFDEGSISKGNDDIYNVDGLTQFSNQIHGYKVLTKEEEQQLFKEYNQVTDEEEKNALKEEICNHNFKLVYSIAHQMYNYYNNNVGLEDLVSYGMEGLLNAVDRFDYKLGYKFSTYSTWWIKQAIGRAYANESTSVRIPVHFRDKFYRYNRTIRELRKKLFREPSNEEIAKAMGISMKEIYEYDRISNLTSQASLDAFVVRENGESDGATIGDFVEGDGEKEIEEAYQQKEERAQLEKLFVLAKLTDREIYVLKERFGFDDYHQKTLETLGNRLGITRERVRQIESKGLRKLKRIAHIERQKTEENINQKLLQVSNASTTKNKREVFTVTNNKEKVKKLSTSYCIIHK